VQTVAEVLAQLLEGIDFCTHHAGMQGVHFSRNRGVAPMENLFSGNS
jgi:hypothetical protein